VAYCFRDSISVFAEHCFHGANDRFDCDCNLIILVFINIFWCTLFVAYFKYLLFYFFIITSLHACSSENIFSLRVYRYDFDFDAQWVFNV